MKITGIMPSYNLLSGQYPFVECLLLALPLVDEMIISDNYSNDGTIEIFNKLSNIDNRIKIQYNKESLQAKVNYEKIDKGLEDIISNSNSDWFIIFHADEFFHPSQYKLILNTIQYCDNNNYNSIRQSALIFNFFACLAGVNGRNVRIFKNVKDKKIKSTALADGFHYEEYPEAREGYGHHNLFPEFNKEEIISCNSIFNFPLSSIISYERHYYDLTPKSDIFRKENAIDRREKFNICNLSREEIENLDVDTLDVLSSFEYMKEIHPLIPEIFYECAKMKKYYVRESLYKEILNQSKISQ